MNQSGLLKRMLPLGRLRVIVKAKVDGLIDGKPNVIFGNGNEMTTQDLIKSEEVSVDKAKSDQANTEADNVTTKENEPPLVKCEEIVAKEEEMYYIEKGNGVIHMDGDQLSVVLEDSVEESDSIKDGKDREEKNETGNIDVAMGEKIGAENIQAIEDDTADSERISDSISKMSDNDSHGESASSLELPVYEGVKVQDILEDPRNIATYDKESYEENSQEMKNEQPIEILVSEVADEENTVRLKDFDDNPTEANVDEEGKDNYHMEDQPSCEDIGQSNTNAEESAGIEIPDEVDKTDEMQPEIKNENSIITEDDEAILGDKLDKMSQTDVELAISEDKASEADNETESQNENEAEGEEKEKAGAVENIKDTLDSLNETERGHDSPNHSLHNHTEPKDLSDRNSLENEQPKIEHDENEERHLDVINPSRRGAPSAVNEQTVHGDVPELVDLSGFPVDEWERKASAGVAQEATDHRLVPAALTYSVLTINYEEVLVLSTIAFDTPFPN
ncbi:hypothetical protein GQR58_008485 [Nymphon striatum]|nr:hypothetical protein GQR58_008485 [Nymphon striatum]